MTTVALAWPPLSPVSASSALIAAALLPQTGDETKCNSSHLALVAQVGRGDRAPLHPRRPVMSFVLTEEEHVLLELIADRPVPAIPALQRHAGPLAASKLIALTGDVEWQITLLGKAMLERMEHVVH